MRGFEIAGQGGSGLDEGPWARFLHRSHTFVGDAGRTATGPGLGRPATTSPGGSGMSRAPDGQEGVMLERALRAARDTRFLAVDAGARHDAATVFASAFGDRAARVVADQRTF